MELSSLVIEGLTLTGESVRIGDRGFHVLVGVVFDVLLKRKDESALSGSVLIQSILLLFGKYLSSLYI